MKRLILMLIALLLSGCSRSTERVQQSLQTRLPIGMDRVVVRDWEIGGKAYQIDGLLQRSWRTYSVHVHHWQMGEGDVTVRAYGSRINQFSDVEIIVATYKYDTAGKLTPARRPDKCPACTDVDNWDRTSNELREVIGQLVDAVRKST